jgi:hypothetical protein
LFLQEALGFVQFSLLFFQQALGLIELALLVFQLGFFIRQLFLLGENDQGLLRKLLLFRFILGLCLKDRKGNNKHKYQQKPGHHI